jgi:hypothetical protein
MEEEEETPISTSRVIGVDGRNKRKINAKNNCGGELVTSEVDSMIGDSLDSSSIIPPEQKENHDSESDEIDIPINDGENENSDYSSEFDLPELVSISTQNKRRKTDQSETKVLKTNKVIKLLNNQPSETESSQTIRISQSQTTIEQIQSELHVQTPHSSDDVNATLRSTGTGTVVIIKPSSDNINELMNDPIEIATIIKESLFGSLNMKDVRTNKKKGLIIAELKQQPNPEIMKNLLDITCLGSWQVKCYLPNSEIYKIGVISPVSVNTNMEKIKELIQTNETDIKIEKIERLKRKTENGWQPSASLKIFFSGKKLPESVTIAYSYYKVRPYVGEPLQCYRCQRLGHTATGCRATVRCLVCGKNHPKEVCQSNYIKCANCNQDHMANSKNCPRMKIAYEIEKVRADTNETYMNARQIVMDQNKDYSINNRMNNFQTHTVEAEVHQTDFDSSRQSYSEIVQSRRPGQMISTVNLNHLSNQKKKTYVNSETQTEPIYQIEYDESMNNKENNFLNKLKNCLLELFQSCIMRESKTSQALLVESAIRHNFMEQPRKDKNNNTEKTPNTVDQSGSAAVQINRVNGEVEMQELEETSVDEEAVISHNSDNDIEQSIWKTIEKKIVKVPNNSNRYMREATKKQEENSGNEIKKQKGKKRKNRK